jgi:hypothetical protein
MGHSQVNSNPDLLKARLILQEGMKEENLPPVLYRVLILNRQEKPCKSDINAVRRANADECQPNPQAGGSADSFLSLICETRRDCTGTVSLSHDGYDRGVSSTDGKRLTSSHFTRRQTDKSPEDRHFYITSSDAFFCDCLTCRKIHQLLETKGGDRIKDNRRW